MTRFIVELKHHAPYDGCFWHWEYYDVRSIGGQIVARPIFAIPVRDWQSQGDMNPEWRWRSGESKMFLDKGYRWATWEELREALTTESEWPFDEATLYTIPGVDVEDGGDYNHNQVLSIPNNIIPNFWCYVNATGGNFYWECQSQYHELCCGEGKTANQPYYESGSRGAGGVAIEVDGWVCDECPDPEEECWNCGQLMERDDYTGVLTCHNPECSESPDYVDEYAEENEE